MNACIWPFTARDVSAWRAGNVLYRHHINSTFSEFYSVCVLFRAHITRVAVGLLPIFSINLAKYFSLSINIVVYEVSFK